MHCLLITLRTCACLRIHHTPQVSRKVAIEVEIEDNTGKTRVFRANNAQSVTRLSARLCDMPLNLTKGWNQVVLDLSTLTHRVFKTQYKHANRVKVYANCRLRRIFFADRCYTDAELPEGLRVFPQLPVEEHNDDESSLAQNNNEE